MLACHLALDEVLGRPAESGLVGAVEDDKGGLEGDVTEDVDADP